ncbi:protein DETOXIFICATION 28-like isoform X2 [Durio zibethinus]|uniref:Protein DETOXIFICATION 28-like isoform X2 n=1 Tax=Durio zibethinus TaxID=66656 RepID=A0A6P5XT52_DURZI|nr:protein DETOXIFICATION 28-like isoform X2 [Durio zibethinus]
MHQVVSYECISIFISESMILLGFFAGIGVRVVNELGAGNAKRAKFATAVDQVEIPTTLLAFNILLNCIQLVLSGVAVGSSSQGVVAFVNIGSYYIDGVPLGVFLGWLQFSITISIVIVPQVFSKRVFSFQNYKK